MTASLLLSAILMGLLGAGHCAAMCGPITLALVTRTPEKPKQPLASHLGRILMYATLGAVIAVFSSALTSILRHRLLQTAWLLLPNFLLILSALYLLGVKVAYGPVENFGRTMWQRFSRVRAWAATQGGVKGDLLRGALWGLLSCGMIYSALALAVLAATPLGGAMIMAAFGASTLPVLLALGIISKQSLQQLQSQSARRLMGGLLLLLVIWNLFLLPGRLDGLQYSFLC